MHWSVAIGARCRQTVLELTRLISRQLLGIFLVNRSARKRTAQPWQSDPSPLEGWNRGRPTHTEHQGRPSQPQPAIVQARGASLLTFPPENFCGQPQGPAAPGGNPVGVWPKGKSKFHLRNFSHTKCPKD